MSNNSERIGNLVKTGKISAKEGEELLAALEVLEARAAEKSSAVGKEGLRRPPSEDVLIRARVFSGEIDREEYLSIQKNRAIKMGALFGLIMWILDLLENIATGVPMSSEKITIRILIFLLGGSLSFGLSMYFFFLKPNAAKVLRWAEEGK